MRVAAVIPARFGSTRLPGKPLRLLAGKPLLQHVWQKAQQISGIDDLVVATDSEVIAERVRRWGGRALLTSQACQSGTDRLAEAMKDIPAELYLNIQGDEPLFQPHEVSRLVSYMASRPEADIGTLVARIPAEKAKNPNLVKVVVAHDGAALYFSRAKIPYPRDGRQAEYLGHIGIYVYRAAVLREFAQLPASRLEAAEQLEQLRLLQAGYRVHCVQVEKMHKGVDTEEDLYLVEKILSDPLAADEDKWGRIRLVITDVDGVLTDGSLCYDADGEALKCFNAKDGLGIALARKAGIEIAVLSGRDCPALRARLKDLGISIFATGILAKAQACASLMEQAGVTQAETLFLGDDLPDAEAFACCALGVTPADAHPKAREKADFITEACGGQGVLREVIDRILGSAAAVPEQIA